MTVNVCDCPVFGTPANTAVIVADVQLAARICGAGVVVTVNAPPNPLR
jgi:hypothetical protein